MSKGDYMLITLKSIVNKMNLQDISIKFYSVNYEDIASGKQSYLMYFRCCDEKEKMIYNNLPEEAKKDYQSTSCCIEIPHLSIEDYMDDINKNHQEDYDRVINELSIYKMTNKEKEAYCLYVILHEMGHHNDFLEMGKNVFLYSNRELEYREYLHCLQKKFFHKTFNKGLLTNDEREEKKKLDDQYRGLLIEKKADEFAFKHFEYYWNIIV